MAIYQLFVLVAKEILHKLFVDVYLEISPIPSVTEIIHKFSI